MMTYEQFLLTKLAEECAEVQKIALKTQQFGMDSIEPGQPFTNREQLYKELNDVSASITMLNTEVAGFSFSSNQNEIMHKIRKVEKFYRASLALGFVGPKG